MATIISVLAIGAFLFVIGAAAFLVIVVNIHRVDRHKRLTEQPQSYLDAATRRFLGACDRNSSLRHSKRS